MLHDYKMMFWKFLKTKLGIRSWEYLKAKIYRKIDKIIYRKKYNVDELMQFLRKMGLKRGDTILVHASWDEFYNFNGTIKEFIDGLIEVVGTEGTIVMPSYPFLRKNSSIFDLIRTPTAAGLIAEEFRKYPGVIRSVNRHSVAALGPNATYLTNEHQFSETSWDEKSPYFKLGQIHAKVFTFGLGSKFVGTIMHVADSVMRTQHPYFEQFFTSKLVSKFRLQNQSVITTESLTAADDFNMFFTYNRHSRIINKYYSRSMYNRTRYSNLTINSYDADYFIERTIELAKSGIVVYSKPDPKPFFTR